MSAAVEYVWEIKVRHLNTYGDRVVSTTPAKIVAATRSEVTDKMRVAFDATYDGFRKFWSHDWVLVSVADFRTTTPTTDAMQAES